MKKHLIIAFLVMSLQLLGCVIGGLVVDVHPANAPSANAAIATSTPDEHNHFDVGIPEKDKVKWCRHWVAQWSNSGKYEYVAPDLCRCVGEGCTWSDMNISNMLLDRDFEAWVNAGMP